MSSNSWLLNAWMPLKMLLIVQYDSTTEKYDFSDGGIKQYI